jgi:hypothetical protein
MSDVVFEEENTAAPRPSSDSTKPSMLVQLVYKTGLAKTPQGAQLVLLVTVIVSIALTAIVLFAGGIF